MTDLYLSGSSATTLSTFVFGRSVIGGPRALINVGRALVFPPAAVPAVAAAPPVAADVPFSLLLVDAPALPAAGKLKPDFFGFFLKQNSLFFNRFQLDDLL